ncbi:MAG: hypothetical protein M1401_03380 [Chloroflexi bacterium]|nr:hypothetical protein [Chloroflexota bacterium]MCL5107909.1 hypothetical protein [Chloroflexota bacterium]
MAEREGYFDGLNLWVNFDCLNCGHFVPGDEGLVCDKCGAHYSADIVLKDNTGRVVYGTTARPDQSGSGEPDD